MHAGFVSICEHNIDSFGYCFANCSCFMLYSDWHIDGDTDPKFLLRDGGLRITNYIYICIYILYGHHSNNEGGGGGFQGDFQPRASLVVGTQLSTVYKNLSPSLVIIFYMYNEMM